MWKRDTLKKKAKQSFKRNYWAMVAVCFLVAFMAGGFSESMTAIRQYSSTAAHTVQAVTGQGSHLTNADSIWGIIRSISENSMANAGGGDVGVINGAINTITQTGGLVFRTVDAVVTFMNGGSVLSGILLLCAALLSAAYFLFVAYPVQVGQARFFLEGRSYAETKISRLFFLYRQKQVWNTVKIMFFRTLFLVLWWCTLVGGVIKTYEYRMIPYILAENPNIPCKQAFALSKAMMQGNKWHAFVLDISFVGWNILSIATGGLLGFFFVNPYRTATNAELYVTLREAAQTEEMPYATALHNLLLIPTQKPNFPENPFQFATEDDDTHRRFITMPNCLRSYSFQTIVLLFFTFSIAGWVWEVLLELVTNGILVNRGTMHGPWLPIYGSGGCLVLLLLQKVRKHPVLTFGLTCLLCGVMEYGTSWYLEWSKGVKWWDYSGYFLNLNGRICLEGVLVFGLGGCAFIYFLAPLCDDLYKKISGKVKLAICCVLLVLFSADFAYSHFHPNMGEGITDYGMPAAVSGSLPLPPKE